MAQPPTVGRTNKRIYAIGASAIESGCSGRHNGTRRRRLIWEAEEGLRAVQQVIKTRERGREGGPHYGAAQMSMPKEIAFSSHKFLVPYSDCAIMWVFEIVWPAALNVHMFVVKLTIRIIIRYSLLDMWGE